MILGVIKDGGKELLFGGTAENISYDNTNSELSSTNVQGAIDELSADIVNAGTVRYDATTDRFQVLLNGIWVNSIKAYADNYILFDGTTFYDSYENGVYKPASATWEIRGGFTINLPNVIAPRETGGYWVYSFAFSHAIDTTEYSACIIDTSAGTLTVDLSSYSQNAYVIMWTTGTGGSVFGCTLSTQKTNWDSGIIRQAMMNITGNVYINNVRLVK